MDNFIRELHSPATGGVKTSFPVSFRERANIKKLVTYSQSHFRASNKKRPIKLSMLKAGFTLGKISAEN